MGRYDNHYTWGLTPGPRGAEARLHVAVGTRVHVERSCSGPGAVHLDRCPARTDRCPGSEKGVPVLFMQNVFGFQDV